MTRRLIEEWLPIAELSEECVRERRSMTALPPTYYLHVWWARRPLVASRAAIMASLLPEDVDRNRFLHALGIHGDPVASRKRINRAKQTGIRFDGNAYSYARAFSYSLSKEDLTWFEYEKKRISHDTNKVLDPTSGGGSIPFETIRSGLTPISNDINPVAALIQKCTYEFPTKYKEDIFLCFEKISNKFIKRREIKLTPIFPPEKNIDSIATNYIFARTIHCPYCGGLVPLSPNWRLAPDGTGVRIVPNAESDPEKRICTFEIVNSVKEQSEGTVSGGRATCPYTDCGRVIDGDTIKSIAQAGAMGEQLYTVVYKKRIQTKTKAGKPGRDRWERGFRAPRPEDDVFDDVQKRLEEKLPYWEAMDMVPNEAFPGNSNDDRPIQYGMPLWRDLFSPRQLYCHCTSVEIFRELLEEEQAKEGFGEAEKAAFAYLALALDKLRDYNSRMTRWISQRQVIANTFDRHDFAFKWSYAEMAPLIAGLGYDWTIEQIEKCLAELLGLLHPDIDVKALKKQKQDNPNLALIGMLGKIKPVPVTLTCKSGDNLDHIADGSIDAVVMDPPYYDNVMYAELSDFFYVWLKRTAGYVYPELFTLPLTDKENEAVANPAKFRGQTKPKELAHKDYQERMASIFAECRRVLKKDGILTLMFTHKATGAWDALAKGLLDAGFVITASWPINTEAEGSLHIRNKAAANSTIFLVCRPRDEEEASGKTVFWEDLVPEVKDRVLDRLLSFSEAGITGIDRYLACFGPALEVFSRHWPVQRGTPRQETAGKRGRGRSLVELINNPYEVTPEEVLQVARGAVKEWALQQILQSQKKDMNDPLLEWFVLAWDTFKAPEFPYDEGLNLARVAGLDLDQDIIKVIAEKKQSNIVLWDCETRAAKSALGPANGSRSMLDALHHAIHTARGKTLQAGVDQLKDYKLDREPALLSAMGALLEVLPPSRTFTGFEPDKAIAPSANDFEILENLRRLAFARDVPRARQLSLFDLPND